MTTSPIPYTLTKQSVTVVVGGSPITVQADQTQFHALRAAVVAEDWDAVGRLLTPADAMSKWLSGTPFAVDAAGAISLDGEALPSVIQLRAQALANEARDPAPILRFWERLQKNPSKRSVDMLFSFLSHQGIPIEADGTFLAYKGVSNDLTDCHTGEHDNSPGAVNEMPRNKISDDPRHACHAGFHVGALAYAGTFGRRVVVCRVDPADVVCVPYDKSQHKMRVCRYEVVGHHAADAADRPLPDDATSEGVDVDFETPEEAEVWADGDGEPSTVEPPTGADEDEGDDASEVTTKPRRGVNRARKFARLSARDLMDASIDDLRLYAGKTLRIVGASRLPGGKSALVSRIVRVRRWRSK